MTSIYMRQIDKLRKIDMSKQNHLCSKATNAVKSQMHQVDCCAKLTGAQLTRVPIGWKRVFPLFR